MIDLDDMRVLGLGMLLGAGLGYLFGRKTIYKQLAGMSGMSQYKDLPPRDPDVMRTYEALKDRVI